DVSPIKWWLTDTQRARFPRLSILAVEILPIPAMSDEPERVFSAARRTVSWERSRLSSRELEHTECLKHWARPDVLLKDSYDLLSFA
ncbi:hypothetical protein M501DRAFT_940719, partial [Patellaria atrata CBS 101060]